MIDSELDLKTAHQKFLDYLKEKGRASATILAYGSDIQQLIDFCQEKDKTRVDQVTGQDLKNFKKYLVEEKYTPKSISRKVNSIRTFFKSLNKKHLVNKNPAVNLSHPKYETKPPRILTKMEYRALRDACRNDSRMSAIIELFLQTGMRIGELASLKLEDIKNDHLQIKAYGSQPARKIPLNQEAKRAIDQYLKARPKSKTKNLFLTKTGRAFLVRNIRGAINRFFKIAGIEEATVNDLRHTFISHQLKAGVPLVLVSKIVGHKRLSTTEKYLKYIEKKPTKEMELKEL